MIFFKTISLLKKCLGEARWNEKYISWQDKFEVFKILFRLRYLVEIKNKEDKDPMQNIFGYKVMGTSYKELLYLFREIFLANEYEFTPIKNNPSILDCGANIGMAIFYFNKKFPACKIVAFEPNPTVYNILHQNVINNNLKNVKVINAALSNKNGEMEFYINKSNSLISSVNRDRGGNEMIKVNMQKLSDVLLNNTFDFAKIDVEGAENLILDDLVTSNCLQNIKEYIFEYHHNTKINELTLSNFLKPFESAKFIYNINAKYSMPGDFQDLSIRFVKR